MVNSRYLFAALLLQFLTLVAAHSHGSHGSMPMDLASMSNSSTAAKVDPDDPWFLPSYSALEAHSSSMLAHIALMVAAWCFLLPIGVMLSIARSRLTVPTQLLFLVLNGCGLFFGIYYNTRTPDLYENNAHHKIGWVATWAVTSQVAVSLLFAFRSRRTRDHIVAPPETSAFLPISAETIAQHQQYYHPPGHKDIRWSGDSGHGTECASSSMHSRDLSPVDIARSWEEHEHCQDQDDEPEKEQEDDGDVEGDDDRALLSQARRQGLFRGTFVHRFLTRRIPTLYPQRVLRLLAMYNDGLDRTILVLGFIALVTGVVTHAGLFRANGVFNGLAHFIKGGIFFWYGLLTLGRWMGCFADLGWAWNLRPSKSEVGGWKASLPSAEFTESLVIWLYGTINVFLEHLAAWGDAWAPQDLEHVSISLMFFGGGLCGMLVESRRVRSWLNTSTSLLPARSDVGSKESSTLHSPPRSYSISLNPFPALIILLLGLMMSSHHQDSMVSTAVHKQWGTLLVGFALARAVTYMLFFISPPTSIYPSRPPSELVSAFCLISGGLIFMASTRDVVRVLEEHDLMAMFVFTVCMGFTAVVMTYEIMVVAVKGWATKRAYVATKCSLRYAP